MASGDTVSAGTYNYLLKDCSCSGNTTFYSPHPIYINEEGENVVQLGSIAIGGFNGLNN